MGRDCTALDCCAVQLRGACLSIARASPRSDNTRRHAHHDFRQVRETGGTRPLGWHASLVGSAAPDPRHTTSPANPPHAAPLRGASSSRIEPGIAPAFRVAELDTPLGIEHLGAPSEHGVVGRLPDAAHRSIDAQDAQGGYPDSGQPMFAPPVPQELQLPPGLNAHVTPVPILLRSDHQGGRLGKLSGVSPKEQKRSNLGSEGRPSKKQRAAQQAAVNAGVVLTTSETLLGTGLAAGSQSDLSLSDRTLPLKRLSNYANILSRVAIRKPGGAQRPALMAGHSRSAHREPLF